MAMRPFTKLLWTLFSGYCSWASISTVSGPLLCNYVVYLFAVCSWAFDDALLLHRPLPLPRVLEGTLPSLCHVNQYVLLPPFWLLFFNWTWIILGFFLDLVLKTTLGTSGTGFEGLEAFQFTSSPVQSTEWNSKVLKITHWLHSTLIHYQTLDGKDIAFFTLDLWRQYHSNHSTLHTCRGEVINRPTPVNVCLHDTSTALHEVDYLVLCILNSWSTSHEISKNVLISA